MKERDTFANHAKHHVLSVTSVLNFARSVTLIIRHLLLTQWLFNVSLSAQRELTRILRNVNVLLANLLAILAPQQMLVYSVTTQIQTTWKGYSSLTRANAMRSAPPTLSRLQITFVWNVQACVKLVRISRVSAPHARKEPSSTRLNVLKTVPSWLGRIAPRVNACPLASLASLYHFLFWPSWFQSELAFLTLWKVQIEMEELKKELLSSSLCLLS